MGNKERAKPHIWEMPRAALASPKPFAVQSRMKSEGRHIPQAPAAVKGRVNAIFFSIIFNNIARNQKAETVQQFKFQWVQQL